jgi:hypothetical protein
MLLKVMFMQPEEENQYDDRIRSLHQQSYEAVGML